MERLQSSLWKLSEELIVSDLFNYMALILCSENTNE